VSSGERFEGVTLALDVDGVLLDPERGGRGSWRREIDNRFGVDSSELSPVFFRRVWTEVVTGARPIEPAVADALDELGWNISVEDFLTCWLEADYALDMEVVEAALVLADQGVRLVLATNQEHRRAAFLNERLGELLPLDDVLYSGALGVPKPDLRFFALASEALGCSASPNRIAFIDDATENVAAAQTSGWTAELFTKTEGWRERRDALVRRAAS
jgi:putative hydrolase of the HAD superfamily